MTTISKLTSFASSLVTSLERTALELYIAPLSKFRFGANIKSSAIIGPPISALNLYAEGEPDAIEKSWAASIIAESKLKKIQKEPGFLKRQAIFTGRVVDSTNLDKGKTTIKSPPSRSASRRRRLADMSWTTEPMDDKLIWVDCEMTGLDYNKEMIMEIGCLITGPNLEEIARTASIIIRVPEEKLAGLDAWCLKHHGDSGLIDACRQSKLTSAEVDDQLLEFVEKFTKQGECPMAGNSIYMDRIFISKQFPKFFSHFHYRNVDVSSIKELARRWYPEEYSKMPKKKFAHRVLDDILDSIAELQYYRSSVFREDTKSTDALEKRDTNKT